MAELIKTSGRSDSRYGEQVGLTITNEYAKRYECGQTKHTASLTYDSNRNTFVFNYGESEDIYMTPDMAKAFIEMVGEYQVMKGMKS